MHTIHHDCRFYRGDRPCLPHKNRGVLCEKCDEYVRASPRVLLIKLGSMGDVVRTTPIVAALHDKHSDMQLTWLVGAASRDLLAGHPGIDRLWTVDGATPARLAVEEFDIAINLDTALDSCALLSITKAKRKIGFSLGAAGEVVCENDEANTWYQMSLFDDLKQANTKTYQEHIFEICGLPWNKQPITLAESEEDHREALIFSARHGMQVHTRPVIGLNLGGGGRWEHKRWSVEYFAALACMLAGDMDAHLLLFYGPDETELANTTLPMLPRSTIDTGGHNSAMRFYSLLGLCDLLVTGDTLGMHLMLAHQRPVVALFGPTSQTEIELYGLGRKIAPELDCLCCYLERCNLEPNCMGSIEPEVVFEACRQLIEKAG
jgi:lipopolysaccharide heptosyltransferase III